MDEEMVQQKDETREEEYLHADELQRSRAAEQEESGTPDPQRSPDQPKEISLVGVVVFALAMAVVFDIPIYLLGLSVILSPIALIWWLFGKISVGIWLSSKGYSVFDIIKKNWGTFALGGAIFILVFAARERAGKLIEKAGGGTAGKLASKAVSS